MLYLKSSNSQVSQATERRGPSEWELIEMTKIVGQLPRSNYADHYTTTLSKSWKLLKES